MSQETLKLVIFAGIMGATYSFLKWFAYTHKATVTEWTILFAGIFLFGFILDRGPRWWWRLKRFRSLR